MERLLNRGLKKSIKDVLYAGIYIVALTFFIICFISTDNPSAGYLPSNRITSVAYKAETKFEILTISVNKLPEIKSMTLQNPDRIIVDFKDTFLPEIHLIKNIHGRAVHAMRISQNTQDHSRLVVDLKYPCSFDLYSSTSPDNKGSIIRIKILSGDLDKDGAHEISENANAVSSTITGIPEIKENDSKAPIIKQKPEYTAKQKPETHPGNEDVIVFQSDILDDIFNDKALDIDVASPALNESNFSLYGTILTRFYTDTIHSNNGLNTNEHTEGILNRSVVNARYKEMITLSALSDYHYSGSHNPEESYDLDLYEASVRYSNQHFLLKAGKQIVRWGKTDQFSPVDTLNPEDIRYFISLDYEDRKKPVWMTDATLRFKDFAVEAVYIPVFESSDWDCFGTDWATYTHLKDDINGADLPDSFKDYVENIRVHTKKPNDSGLNGEYAFRLLKTFKGWDIGATYHYTWEDMPFYKSFPVKNLHVTGSVTDKSLVAALDNAVLTPENIEVEYLRSHIAGFEFETTLADFGFRGEAAWHDRESFLTSSLVSVRKPSLYTIIGVDYTSEDQWYLNVQLNFNHIEDYDDSILYFKRNAVSMLGEINKTIFSSWVKAILHYSISLSEDEFYFSPRLEYTYIPNLDILLGVHIFEGSSNSLMGRFDGNDQVFCDVKYHF